MNDMLVQQNGLASTGENAAQIASMLGKVMEGQTGALSRYGYKFDEAQEKILKYGTEAEKVAVLCEVVSDSVGGMNRKMAQTDVGKIQQYKNNLGDLKEQLGGLVKGSQVFLTLAANATIALGGIIKLVKGVKALTTALNLAKVAGGWLTLTFTAIGTGLVWLLTRTNEATDALDEFANAEERAARAAEMAQDSITVSNNAELEAATSIRQYISELKSFNGSKKEEKRIVQELNATYGKTMGYFKSVSEWYHALTENSKAYTEQIKKEAKARLINSQISEIDQKQKNIVEDENGNLKKYSTKSEWEWQKVDWAKYNEVRNNGGDAYKKQGFYGDPIYYAKVKLPSEAERAQAAVNEYSQQKKQLEEDLSNLEKTEIKMPVMGSIEEPTLELKDEKQVTRLQQINKLLTKLNEEYVTATDSRKVQIRTEVQALTDEKNTIELAQTEMQRPIKLDSIDAYTREINYWTKKRSFATEEEIVNVDKTIRQLEREKVIFASKSQTELNCLDDYERELSRLQQLRKIVSVEEIVIVDQAIEKITEQKEAEERAAHVRVPAEKITSYKQLEEEIRFCTELLREGSEEEKEWAKANLPEYQKKERAMSAAMSAIGVAERPEDANTLEELEASISLYTDMIQRASATEIDGYVATKREFEKKKEAIERGIKIPEMQKEVQDILDLPDFEMKIKVNSMGFEQLTDKLREIQKMLDDVDNPPTEGQRNALEKLKSVYEEWRRQGVQSFSTFTDGWSSMKSIGSSVESITNALQDNTNIWNKLTTVVDGFISIYSGIEEVIKIMQMLGIVTKANTAAKTAEAAATGASTAATVADAAVADTAAAAQAPVVAANKLATQSFVELAAAEYMAAHASIPFAGFAIGSAFATGAEALVKTIGATPFADGGVVYGPTLGLVGEYAGASSNPEVIAPLDKLRDIIGTAGGGQPVIVGGRIEVSGRQLAVVLENQSKIAGLSGKRYKL